LLLDRPVGGDIQFSSNEQQLHSKRLTGQITNELPVTFSSTCHVERIETRVQFISTSICEKRLSRFYWLQRYGIAGFIAWSLNEQSIGDSKSQVISEGVQ
jgi:hypothetical protein